jgi:protein transport protein SEC61 subunit gamma and related proteins
MDAENSRAENLQDDLEAKARGIGKGKYGRILKMARTPTKEEYKRTVFITALGIIILGAAGFAIMWVMTYLPTYF